MSGEREEDFCEDGACGRCALCVAEAAAPRLPGASSAAAEDGAALVRVRERIAAEEPGLRGSLGPALVPGALALAYAVLPFALHGVGKALGGGLALAAAAALGLYAWRRPGPVAPALLLGTPLLLLIDRSAGGGAESPACAAMIVAGGAMTALVGLWALRRLHGAGHLFGYGGAVAAVAVGAATQVGCPKEGLLHGALFHALPAAIAVVAATLVGGRFYAVSAPSTGRSRGAAEKGDGCT